MDTAVVEDDQPQTEKDGSEGDVVDMTGSIGVCAPTKGGGKMTNYYTKISTIELRKRMSEDRKKMKGGAMIGIRPEMSKNGPISSTRKSRTKNTDLKRKMKKIGGAKSRNGREF